MLHFFLLPALERSNIDQCNQASGMRREESVSSKGEETSQLLGLGLQLLSSFPRFIEI